MCRGVPDDGGCNMDVLDTVSIIRNGVRISSQTLYCYPYSLLPKEIRHRGILDTLINKQSLTFNLKKGKA